MFVQINICGVDVNVRVILEFIQKPNKNADCEADYNGYVDFEYELHHFDNQEFTIEEWNDFMKDYNDLSYYDSLKLRSDIETVILKM